MSKRESTKAFFLALLSIIFAAGVIWAGGGAPGYVAVSPNVSNPSGTLPIANGGTGHTNGMMYTLKAAAYTVLAADNLSTLDVDASTNVNLPNITLPAAATIAAGFTVWIKKADSGANVVPITCNVADGINGSAVPTALSITNVARSTTTVTLTVSSTAALVVGEPVTVAAVTNTTISGTFLVKSITNGTVFTYTDVTSGTINTGADTGTCVPTSTFISKQYATLGIMSSGVAGVGKQQGWTVIECNGDSVSAATAAFTWTATSAQWGDPSTTVPPAAGCTSCITLPPGEWDVDAVADYAATLVTVAGVGIGTVTGNSAPSAQGDNWTNIFLATAATDGAGTIPSYRVTLTAPTIYYLKMFYTYTGAPTVNGRISARRIR